VSGRAALPMYDLPELAPATDAFYAALREALLAHGIDAPPRLSRSDAPIADRALVFGQICGYPFAKHARGTLTVVAAPRYRGESGASYRSFLVVGASSRVELLEDLAGSTCAMNDRGSQSGMNALRARVAPLAREGRFFGRVLESGAHRASLAMVADGRADVAAIDCVTHALVARVEPVLTARTRILEATAPAPAPPFVTATADPDRVRRIRAALFAVLDDPSVASARAALLLEGADAIEDRAYDVLVELERSAAQLGYPDLA
jgi:ABC-type phosphate/phosphonate transport system substrate-binding protein